MLINEKELAGIRREHSGQSIALRFGCFDLLHEEHSTGLQFAAEQADRLVVGITPDEFVRRQKGPNRPIYPDLQRAAAVDELGIADYTVVIPEHKLAIAGLFIRLRPDVYIEHIEYGNRLGRRLFLGAIGVQYTIDYRERTMSSSGLLAQMRLDNGPQAA